MEEETKGDQPNDPQVDEASTNNQLVVELVLHNFRSEIDQCIKRAELYLGTNVLDDQMFNESTLKTIRTHSGREMALVRTKLQEAKMWAGKCLEAVGAPFPAELRDEAVEPEQPIYKSAGQIGKINVMPQADDEHSVA